MPQLVCNGAMLQCSFGVAPSSLIVLPVNRVLTSNQPAATILDHVPMVNIMPFGMCSAPTNPAVIAANGSPVPCVPVTPAPWMIGAPTVLEGNMPVLNNTSKLMCTWLGIISVTYPGQVTEQTP